MDPSAGFWCPVNGIEVQLDSSISCTLYQFPYSLNEAGFGYITLAFWFPIFAVSIFGTIKDCYRWFILNQAYWDLLVVYHAICDKPSNREEEPTCFYSFNSGNKNSIFGHLISAFFANLASNAAYVPLFLLATSRFATMYFRHSYDRFAKPLNLALLIVIVHLISVIVMNLWDWFNIYSNHLDTIEQGKCAEFFCPDWNASSCDQFRYTECLNAIERGFAWELVVLNAIKYLFPPAMLLLTNIFAASIIVKVASQLRYQASHSRKSLISSLKISAVITFQCIFLTFLCLISLYSTYVNNFERFWGLQFPPWFVYLTRQYTIHWLCVCRVCCDCILMLIILTEYRQNIKRFGNFVASIFLKSCSSTKIKDTPKSSTRPTTKSAISRHPPVSIK